MRNRMWVWLAVLILLVPFFITARLAFRSAKVFLFTPVSSTQPNSQTNPRDLTAAAINTQSVGHSITGGTKLPTHFITLPVEPQNATEILSRLTTAHSYPLDTRSLSETPMPISGPSTKIPSPAITPTFTLTARPTQTYTITATATITKTPTPTTTSLPTFTPTKTPIGQLDRLLAGSPALCISYHDEFYNNLKFVCRSIYLKWMPVEIVDGNDGVGLYSSLAFDSEQKPWIAYSDIRNGDLKLASLEYAGWQIITVDKQGDTGWYPSLALDAKGHPVIAYYDATNNELRLARFTDTGVYYFSFDQIGPIKEEDRNDFRISLAIGKNDRIFVAYRDNLLEQLKVAVIDGEEVKINTVDTGAGTGYSASLALLPDDTPVVAFYSKRARTMFVGQWNKNTFDIVSPDSQAKSGRFLSMTVDLYGNPTLGYFSDAADDLRFVRRTSAGWMRYEVVDTFGSKGWYPSLDMDKSGRISIAFYDHDQHKLRVISKQDNLWQHLGGDPDGASVAGLHPSLKYLP